MNIAEAIINFAIKLGIGLALTGGLAKATYVMALKAAKAPSQMISLGDLSRQLESGGHYHSKKYSPP